MNKSTTGRKSQEAEILRLLLEARGGEVPLPAIRALGIAQHSARFHSLKKKGFKIRNRMQVVDGEVHSFYRLENEAATDSTKVNTAEDEQQELLPRPKRSWNGDE